MKEKKEQIDYRSFKDYFWYRVQQDHPEKEDYKVHLDQKATKEI